MKLLSPAFPEDKNIPSKYTCEGENISPPLEIDEVDERVKSLALMVVDPDAPNNDFVHWIVYNIDPKTTLIKEGQKPAGAQEGSNDFGETGYGGPCPPSGEHRYQFHLYALNSQLDFENPPDKTQMREALKKHILEEAILTGLYERKTK